MSNDDMASFESLDEITERFAGYGNVQEIEEREFNRMGPAEESAWQHTRGGTCSLDCARCDPYDPEEYEALGSVVEERETARLDPAAGGWTVYDPATKSIRPITPDELYDLGEKVQATMPQRPAKVAH